MAESRPLVLCVSGHDPGGGAGIQADIEAAAALGAHAMTVIAAHTVQDTRDVARVQPADVALMREQLALLLADARPGAIKVGLLGSPTQLPLLADVSRRVRAPLVADPVLRAGGGARLPAAQWLDALRRELLPIADVLTPNAAEARTLAECADLDAAGVRLLALGARHVLITGGDEPGDVVVNRWFEPGRAPRRFAWPRLPGVFHGAGCTLAAAIAALLARGLPPAQAVEDAQAYTQRALGRAMMTGRGRPIPGRLT